MTKSKHRLPPDRVGPTSKAVVAISSARPLAILLTLVVFSCVFITLEVVSYTQESATWDEPIHLTDGYVSLAQHDYRVDPEHPPFLRMWAALPLLAIHSIKLDTAVIDATPPTDWALSKLFLFTHGFIYVDNDSDRMLYAARFMMVLLGVILGILIFCWVNEWLGFRSAVVSLAFYTLEPNLAAHAALVTTDFGVTCFIFGTVYFLWRICRQVTILDVVGLTAFFALSIVSKFSGLIVAPLAFLLLGIAWFYRPTMSFKTLAGILVLLGASAWISIWAIYGFRYAPSASSTWLFHFQDNAMVLERVPSLARFLGSIDKWHLLPNVFTQGFLLNQAKAQLRSAFLAGSYSDVGWWYYFPIAFLIKTPIALVALFVGGCFVFARRWHLGGFKEALFVVLPVAVILGVAMTQKINIGVRHILPIYPFVILAAVGAAHELFAYRPPVGRTLLGILAFFWIFEFGRAYPDNLAFFNQFVGGPTNGIKYLADSNIDWGQGLKQLKGWMDQRQVSHINLAYFGSADPTYYHINCTWLPGSPFFAPNLSMPQLPGYVAVSATVLSGVYSNEAERAFYRHLAQKEPVAEIGGSIFVYWVDRPWW